MFDRNPRKVFHDLMSILLTHLKAQGVIEDMELSEFLTVLFSDKRSAILLARASEGNPRDFLSILNICINELDGIGSSDAWIDSHTILCAAEKWYIYDKKHMIENLTLHQKLLDEIFSYVVDKNNTRGFIIEETYLTHVAIQPLIDARLLHVAKTGQHYYTMNSQNYALLVLDFGTYISYLTAKRDIHLFIYL